MQELDLGVTIRGFIPDQKVFNRFILKRIVGRGGMGVVWLAHDQELDRPVALKFLPEIVALDPVSIAELKRETRRNLDLTHPHIVRIYDFVQDARSAAISMEYVDGPSVSALRAERPRGIFPLAELQRMLEQLAAGLTYAHERAKVVHRDLKPANLMLTSAGDLKITDFGIATSISDSVSRISGRSTSGTAAYMSPQQMMGDRPAPTDDIYAVGATLYELLTGKPPFHSGNILAQVTNKVPPSISERRAELGVTDAEPVPASWEVTVARCLAKEPQYRPQSVRALLEELNSESAHSAKVGHGVPDAAGAGSSAALEPERPRSGVPTEGPNRDEGVPAPLTARAASNSRTPLLIALAAVAVVALAAVGYFFMSRPAQDEAPTNHLAQSSDPRATNPPGTTPSQSAPIESPKTAADEPARDNSAALDPTPRRADPPLATVGSVLITSDPDDAEVTLGDTTRRTPTQFQNVPAGRVTITVAKAGYETRRLDVDLAAGQSLQVPVIQLAPLTYDVALDATTNDVTYLVDANGESLRGKLPAQLKLPAGRYPISYSRPGYGDRYEALVVTETGARATADLRGGTLQLESTPAGAEVLLDGRAVGRAPLRLADLRPGPRQFELRLAHHLPRTVSFTTLLGRESTETVTLEPDPQYTYLMALQGHWAAGLNGLRFTDTSGSATYRAGANFVKGRNFPMKLVRFDAATQTGVFRPDDPKLPTFEIVLRAGTVVLRWQTNGKGRYYDVPMTTCTEEYFNKAPARFRIPESVLRSARSTSESRNPKFPGS